MRGRERYYNNTDLIERKKIEHNNIGYAGRKSGLQFRLNARWTRIIPPSPKSLRYAQLSEWIHRSSANEVRDRIEKELFSYLEDNFKEEISEYKGIVVDDWDRGWLAGKIKIESKNKYKRLEILVTDLKKACEISRGDRKAIKSLMDFIRWDVYKNTPRKKAKEAKLKRIITKYLNTIEYKKEIVSPWVTDAADELYQFQRIVAVVKELDKAPDDFTQEQTRVINKYLDRWDTECGNLHAPIPKEVKAKIRRARRAYAKKYGII